MAGLDPGARDKPSRSAVSPEEITQRKRQILEVGAEAVGTASKRLASVLIRRTPRQVPARCQAPLVKHPLGLFHHDAEEARHRPVVVKQRAIGEGVVGLFRKSTALQQQQHAFAVVRLAGFQNLLDQRPDVGPDLPPDFGDRSGEAQGCLTPKVGR